MPALLDAPANSARRKAKSHMRFKANVTASVGKAMPSAGDRNPKDTSHVAYTAPDRAIWAGRS